MPDEIQHLSTIEHVRLRPELYFGDRASPHIPNCLAKDAFCLAIDQILAGNCTRLVTDLKPDGMAWVTHNGEPLGVAPEGRFQGRSEMEDISETMRACAARAASQYVSRHICGNGMTAVNAVCERFEVHNFRDSQHYVVAYTQGDRVSPLQILGPTIERGVSIRFKPDGTLLRHIRFDLAELQAWFASLELNVQGLEVLWLDERQ